MRTITQVRKYVSDLLPLMGLSDWEISVSESDRDDMAAEIECLYGQRRAYISLGKNYFSKSREVQRQDIVHELVHCHMDGISQAWDGMKRVIGSSAWDASNSVMNVMFELAVDNMATAWSRSLPLPK